MALVARRTGKRRRLMADINVVPYVDVMLVLGRYLDGRGAVRESWRRGTADRCQGRAAEGNAGASGRAQRWPSLRVRRQRRDRRFRRGSCRLLCDSRQKGDPKTPVVIEADSKVQYDAVIGVMSVLQKAGVQSVGLSLRPAQ